MAAMTAMTAMDVLMEARAVVVRAMEARAVVVRAMARLAAMVVLVGPMEAMEAPTAQTCGRSTACFHRRSLAADLPAQKPRLYQDRGSPS